MLAALSLLMWECGLKQNTTVGENAVAWSLLMWECGLKHRQMPRVGLRVRVTPYVGVWIETKAHAVAPSNIMSLLMWECGLKPPVSLV